MNDSPLGISSRNDWRRFLVEAGCSVAVATGSAVGAEGAACWEPPQLHGLIRITLAAALGRGLVKGQQDRRTHRQQVYL